MLPHVLAFHLLAWGYLLCSNVLVSLDLVFKGEEAIWNAAKAVDFADEAYSKSFVRKRLCLSLALVVGLLERLLPF